MVKPMNQTKKSILILAEGYEEKPYIDKILHFPSISKNYSIKETINLKGNGRIVSRYQYELQCGRYDLILVFCDADEGSKQFHDMVCEIGKNVFGDRDKGILVFIYSNPVTLQIVLSHFSKVELKDKAKKQNQQIIFELTGIKNYDAKEDQIKELIDKITYTNYQTMKDNLKDISSNYKDIPSTNILLFLNRFESDDVSWVDEINKEML